MSTVLQTFEMTASDKEMRGYSIQRLKSARDTDCISPAIKWITVENTSVCEFGKLLHGKQFATSDALWPHCLPPLHTGCGCRISGQMANRVKDVEKLTDYFKV